MVSGNAHPVARPATTDRHPKVVNDRRAKEVGMAIITEPEVGAITCSCGGFTAIHVRAKVRSDKAQRHVDKKHGGAGLWL